MLRFSSYKRPASLEEALGLIERNRRARVLGGGAWLRLGKAPIPVVVDLIDCHVDAIEDIDGYWRIGAYATLRDIELHAGLNASCGGVLAQAVRSIVGVQFRAGATVGGSVFGRFGFSDVCCALLALGADVEFVGAGRMPLSTFLSAKATPRDVLAYVYIPRSPQRAGYSAVRRAATDIPVLNACAALAADGGWRVAVGARPGRARLVEPAEPCIPAGCGVSDEVWADAARDLSFGSNMWASAAYRRRIAPVLVRRAQERARAGEALSRVGEVPREGMLPC